MNSNRQFFATATSIFLFLILSITSFGQSATTTGELKKWHRLTITFDGPLVSETSSSNPFLNYRLNVTFKHSSGKSYNIPGYFAADGNAGETGATSGNKWKVHFSPDETGTWTYLVSMRQATNIAVSDDLNAGTAVSPLNGATGSVSIVSSDKTGKDLRAKGVLKYVGSHYLQFAETGEYFVKAGADSPENFLAYNDFDNTPNNGTRRKSWSPHVQDWITGDPTWKGGKGKGIIGAVNYLSAQGMNVFSFLTMNIKGDDQNVFPYINSTDFTRMDVSKLDQWEIVFEHAQKMGMYLHFKLQEVENNSLLDAGNLGTQRKLYLRELIARFSHHLALNWNVGEENMQTDAQRKAMAKYIYDHDPYNHHIVIHTYPGQQEQIYRPLLGSASSFSGISIQTSVSNVYTETRKWVEASASAGKKWVVANDEQNSATNGVATDAEYTGNRGSVADNSESIRKDVLWGNLMAGGGGVEYYFGYNTGETDLSAQDYRSRAKSWRYAKHALDFFRTYLPFNEMKALNNVSSGWSFGKAGEAYVVYLKGGGSPSITLPTGNYTVKWYNPRTGGVLQNGSKTSLTSGTASIGTAPSGSTSDWAVLIRNNSTPSNNTPTVSLVSPVSNSSYDKPAIININANAADTDGTISKVEFYSGSAKIAEVLGSPYSYAWTQPIAGTYAITAKAFDNQAASTTSSPVNINVTTATAGVIFAINAGGNAFTASNGITYQADKSFTGGTVFSTTGSIANTTDDALYLSERYGNFSYSIPVSNGNYELLFKFAEIFHQSTGKRIFNVLVEGSNVISNLDIFSVAGYKTAYDVLKTVSITDGAINISFSGITDRPKLSALSVKGLTFGSTLLSAAPLSLMSNQPLLKTDDVILSIENPSVYPNPSSGLVNVLSDKRYPSAINVYNSQGKIVFSNKNASTSHQINLTQFGAGVYYIHLQNNGKKFVRKVIITQ